VQRKEIKREGVFDRKYAEETIGEIKGIKSIS
jgi:hypothetical protein